MSWSKYQNDIFEYALGSGNGSFVVNAVAGSGKTTTIVECARRMAEANPTMRILFLAFNKEIVKELSSRVENFPNIKCSTLHSFGLSCLYRSNMKFEPKDTKWKEYLYANAEKLSSEPFGNRKFAYIHNLLELFNLCRINLVQPRNKQQVIEVANKHNIDQMINEYDVVANKLMPMTMNMAMFRNQGKTIVDFVDMITMPLQETFRRFIPKYDVVFIDEAQDLSAAQQQLMLQSVKSSGKFIGVGDPKQSISGFAGSLSDSFYQLANVAQKTLPLSVNYRCGKNIINEAKAFVKEIEAHDGAIDGEVVHQKDMRNVQIGDMVICRKTAPLVKVVIKMMAEGISAHIKGKDIAQGLKAIVERVNSNNLGMDSMRSQLENMLEEMKRKLQRQGFTMVLTHPLYVDLADKITSILTIASKCNSPSEIIEILDKIFIDVQRGDTIMLSTVHKAKGLEAENVFIICPELLPMTWKNQQDWEYEQEKNLKYVAITRAKNRLTFVDMPEEAVGYLDFSDCDAKQTTNIEIEQ